MAPSDLVYCEQCGGASPRRATACRFCGAPLPPPRAPVRPPTEGPATQAGGPIVPDDDPWADLHEPDGEPAPHDPDPWVDPDHLPWRGGDAPGAGDAPGGGSGPPVPPDPGAESPHRGVPPSELAPTELQPVWSEADLIEPMPDEPRRGLPGWAWVASVVVLGTLLGVGAYIVVDQADDDGSVRTEQSTTTSSSTTSTTTTTATTTTAPTIPPTTAPVVPATPPATAPDTGPPTVPGAVTSPTTLAPTTLPPTTPAPTTPPPPTTPAPTTPPPTTPAPTTPPPTTAPAPPGTVPGDLGIPGVPMAQPACDGQYVTFLASVKTTTASAMQEALASFPGSHYLRTDQSCPSLNAPASDGAPLYRIFVGPYADVNEACAARAMSTQGAFVKRASNDDPPAHAVACP